jgi:hypothetical protein
VSRVRWQELREAKIEHLGLPSRGHEDVGGLEIAVDDLGGMRRIESIGHLTAQMEEHVQRQRTSRETVCERLALQVFNDEVVGPTVFASVQADVVQRADIGMGEHRNRLCFALEALPSLGVCGGQDLDGNPAVEPRVAGFVDLAHPASADLGKHFIRTEVVPCPQPVTRQKLLDRVRHAIRTRHDSRPMEQAQVNWIRR